MQWKGYLPGLVGAVMVWVPPLPAMTASNSPAVSEVRVWPTASELVTVIVAPGVTLTGTVYLKFLMVIFAAAAGAGAAVEELLVEELLLEGFDVPDPVAGLVALAAGVLEEALTGGVEDGLGPVLVDCPPLLQAPRRKILQVAASAPAVRRAVIAVRPISGWRFLSRGVRHRPPHRWGPCRTPRPACVPLGGGGVSTRGAPGHQ